MSRWRILTVVSLIGLPFLVLAGLGSYFLWTHGWTYLVWWPLTLVMAGGYLLGWYWQRRRKLLRPADFEEVPAHWTERDRGAWELVAARAKAAAEVKPERLTELQFYLDTARDMALELARFYHPRADDPVSNLTIPEILAVAELAARDMAELVDEYLPAGHLLTVRHWKQAKQATEWYSALSKIYWLVSAVFAPVNTGLRYAVSQAGMAKPFQQIQQDLITWFYVMYVHRVGTYLIDLNSGRLRVGAARYRTLVRPDISPPREPGADEPLLARRADESQAEPAHQVTLLVFGQVKAGKSSFINAVLGERKAVTDILPATNEVERYEVHPPGVSSRLVLLDSVGYGNAGPRDDQVKATEDAARQADLLLLVVHAKNPARQADLDMLQRLRQWYASHPELRMPPILGVMTHIDLLSPGLEWSPPYNWQEPSRPKEKGIKDAWDAVREQLGAYLVGIVPVCTAAGKVYGVEEWFLPTLAELLDEAHAVALLRCLRAEADTGKVRKVFRQLLAAGTQAAQVVWAQAKK